MADPAPTTVPADRVGTVRPGVYALEIGEDTARWFGD